MGGSTKGSKKRGPGRPRLNQLGSSPVFTQLPPEVLARVDALADQERRSRSAMLSMLVERGLEVMEKRS